MLIEAAILLITVVRDIRHCQNGGIFNLRELEIQRKIQYNDFYYDDKKIFFLEEAH